ncbi:MAG TPA: 50S ribosomal protein L30 [Bacteroidales bacterium]|nr:50S ribosomal protein L30 [Bacteroidales bacterium]
MHSLWRNTGVCRWKKCLTADVNNNKMAKIRITQVRSRNGRPERQKRTLDALGIRKLNHSVEHEATPQIIGMVNKIRHLVRVENI